MVDNISHLPDQQQAEVIAEQFASIQNEHDAIKKDNISIPLFDEKPNIYEILLMVKQGYMHPNTAHSPLLTWNTRNK